jgi:transcription initiation factor TFIIB
MYTRAIKLIKRYCDVLDLRDNIIRQVEEIYYEIQDKQELKGKRLEVVIAACIYLACKQNLVNIHPTSLEPLADVSQAKILKMSKIILKFIPIVTIHASEYIQLFCSKLQVSNEHTQDMIAKCKKIESFDFFNKQLPKPRTIAAALIYFYLSEQDPKCRKSLQEIKDVAGILTDNTIKKYYYMMQERRSLIFDDEVAPAETGSK